MSKVKQQVSVEVLSTSEEEMNRQIANYAKEIDNNPQYSLRADPDGSLKLSPEQKNFIEAYIQFKNIAVASELAGIEVDKGKELFAQHIVQMELIRINAAIYHRQFKTKMLSLDEIGGYLSALLTDNNVPYADRLRTNEKLAVVRTIIDLQKFKRESFIDTSNINNVDFSYAIKDLSVKTIKKLLTGTGTNELGSKANLSEEEKKYIESLDAKELLELVEGINK